VKDRRTASPGSLLGFQRKCLKRRKIGIGTESLGGCGGYLETPSVPYQRRESLEKVLCTGGTRLLSKERCKKAAQDNTLEKKQGWIAGTKGKGIHYGRETVTKWGSFQALEMGERRFWEKKKNCYQEQNRGYFPRTLGDKKGASGCRVIAGGGKWEVTRNYLGGTLEGFASIFIQSEFINKGGIALKEYG